jgi:hypothetical protein
MKYFKRIFIVVLFGLFFLYKGKEDNSEQFVRRREALQRLMKNAAELQRIWIEGEDSKEWSLVKNQCLKKKGITQAFNESLLRCNPFLIDCVDQFVEKKPFFVKNATFIYPSYVYTLEDFKTHEQLAVSLSDNCHQLYLEQNIYFYGEAPKSMEREDYQFDNFNQHLYFDQHLVTNNEVNEWIKYDRTISTQGISPVLLGENLFTPAVHLTVKQMSDYCSFKGQQLMSAAIYDAATFLSRERNRSPYYWTKKSKNVELNCNLLFSKDCLSEKKWTMNYSLPSWAGLYDSLGGVMEAVRNPIDIESNLKASSLYFSKNSLWHQLGVRAHWDGLGHVRRNFNFKGHDPLNTEDNYQVGFRCMREVAP